MSYIDESNELFNARDALKLSQENHDGLFHRQLDQIEYLAKRGKREYRCEDDLPWPIVPSLKGLGFKVYKVKQRLYRKHKYVISW